jgi:hypothetical protein
MDDVSELFSNYWYWIFLIVSGFLLTFITPWLIIWRYRAKQKWLRENGRSATAKILKIWDNGTTIGYGSNSNMVGVGLLLEVYPEGGEPYQVKARDQLHVMDLSRVAPGMMIEVRVHPNKPDKVIVSQWNVSGAAQITAEFLPQTAPDQKLQLLKQMRDKGLITTQEYESKKTEILANL